MLKYWITNNKPASGGEGTGNTKEDDLFTGSKRVYRHVLELILFVEISELSIRQDITDSNRSHIESTVVLILLLLPSVLDIIFKWNWESFGIRCEVSGRKEGGSWSCDFFNYDNVLTCHLSNQFHVHFTVLEYLRFPTSRSLVGTILGLNQIFLIWKYLLALVFLSKNK